MAVRNEYVRLSLDDDFTTGMARATAATALFRKALGDLDGTQTSVGTAADKAGDSYERSSGKLKKYTLEMAVAAERDARLRKSLRDQAKAMFDGESATDGARKAVKGLGDDAGRAGPEIDRLSGRLRLFRDAAITLGPALVPLGAAAIPVLTGAIAGLGAAAGGLGVTILALKGVGDAMKAIDDYRLEPTAENLQAVRVEMEKLGPAGAHFVRYLESIEDELGSLQMAAREGFLPGLEDGIDSALQRLPQVRDLVRDLAEGMGELAASAGRDLAGGDWAEFFAMLDRDGRDTLVSFSNAVGDITNGLADMLVAFAPLNRDFAEGLEGMAQSFADWADGLNESQGFAEFLDYIRTNGPRALDMLGSLARTFASIAEAAAPVGAVTLPILTKLLDVIGAIAGSPLGTPFIIALGAVTAYSRAVDLATAATTRFTAAKATGFASASTILPIAAATVTISQYVDMMDEAEEATRIWNESMANGTLTVDDLKAKLQSMQDEGTISGLGDLLKTAMDPSAWVKTALPGFLLWKNEVDQTTSAAARLAGNMEIVAAQTKNTDGLAALFGETIGQTGRQMRVAAGDARALEGALAGLVGWLDKRQAIRDYNASIRELSRSMRNGFTRTDVENLDQIGRNIAQVASQITNPTKRAAFLENARAQLEALAENGGPKAQRAVEQVVRKLEALGLVKAEPEVDVDTSKADRKLRETRREFDIFDALSSTAALDANAGGFYGVFNPAMSALDRFDGRVATATLQINRRYSTAAAQGVGPAAINNEAPQRTSAGRVTGRTSAPTGFTLGRDSADDKAAMYAGMFRNEGFVAANTAAAGAANGLKGLQAQLAKAEKALEKERRQRDAVRDQMNSLASSVSSGLQSDIWAASEGSSNPWAAGAVAGGVVDPNAVLQADIAKAKEFNEIIKSLKARGLDGPALAEVLMSGDIERARLIASMSAADLADYERLYEERAAVTGAAGQSAGMAVFGAALAREEKQLAAIREEVKGLRQDVRNADKNNQSGHQNTASSNQGWQSAQRQGHRRAKVRGGA